VVAVRLKGTRLLSIALLVSVAAVAGCSGDTDPATNVGVAQADLNGTLNWDNGDGPGQFWWSYRETNSGDTGWQDWTKHSYPHLTSSGSLQASPETVTGLQPGTEYDFRICGNGDKDAPTATACADSNGNFATVYDTFVTSADCDTTVAPSSLQSAINAQPNGATICMSAGTGSGSITASKPGQTIRAAVTSGAGGSIADVTLNGRISVTGDDVSLRQFTIVQQASDQTAGTVKVTADDVVLDHMDINANAVHSAVLAGGGAAGEEADGLQIHNSKLHGATASRFDHPLYLFKLTGGTVDHSWLYLTKGWILHLNGDVNQVTIDHVVGDDSLELGNPMDGHRGITFNTDTPGAVPDNNHIQNSIITDAEGIRCENVGTGNVVTNLQMSPYDNMCSSPGVTFTNISTADPSYVAEGSDYRVQGKADFQFIPGPQP
jgi:hypothetical protein